MKLLILLALLVFSTCAPELTNSPYNGVYDLKAEVERYLETIDSNVETEVLKGIKTHQISNKDIKLILLQRASRFDGVKGLQRNLNINRNGKTYPYSLYVPTTPIPDKGWPLIIILHGMGGRGETTILNWVSRLKDRFVIACPSYPMGAWWSSNAEHLVLELIHKLQKTHLIDRNRIFLSGLSNGAIGAFLIGMNYPDRFAGLAPIAGGITERLMHFLVNLRNTPIYIVHGKRDPIFPVTYLRRVHRILSDMKYPAVYREHSETISAHGGHFMPNSELSPLLTWLEDQKRNTLPKTIRITREENHLGPIHWARITKGLELAALQMPGPEKEPLNIKDGKIATLFISRRTNNRFEATTKNVLEYEIYLNSDMINFDQPVRVTNQELRETKKELVPGEVRMRFNQKVKPHSGVLLSDFKKRRDPDLLYDAIIKIKTETQFEIASKL